jgi:hypothetical protein
MMNSGFTWVVSPNVIADGLERYGERALVAVQAVGNYWGQQIQDDARKRVDSEHLWVNRTGNARGGLFFAVDGFGLEPLVGEVEPDAKAEMSDIAIESGDANTLIITLAHTVYYGKFLELSNGGTHAVIMSTMEKNLPSLERLLQAQFQG